MLKVQLPGWLKDFVKPKRYKIAYGGRGSGKSWGFVQLLVLKASQSRIRILCARELQNSIRESVHQLIAEQIVRMGLEEHFSVKEKGITCITTGSEFIFKGLKGVKNDASALKSFEGADICWIEEAQTVSRDSLETLKPTIRKPGAEIWMTFNPKHSIDPVYKDFVITPPSNALVKKVNYSDNPWFYETSLPEDMEHMKLNNYDLYLHVWEGETLNASEMQFIPANDVDDAMKRDAVTNPEEPLVIAVDVARFGDDESVIFFRKGMDGVSIPKITFKGLDTMQVAAQVALHARGSEHTKMQRADAVFVDETGVGGGVVDRLRQLGVNVIGVNFGGKPDSGITLTNAAGERYGNKRAEIWGIMRSAIRSGLCLPKDQSLKEELIAVEYSYNEKGEIMLERKSDLKKRLGFSPDTADAIAISFAYPVVSANTAVSVSGANHEYNPYD